MKALHLLISFIALFGANICIAQSEKSSFHVIENLKTIARAVSADGRYICGDHKGFAFIHDTNTNTTIEIPSSYNDNNVQLMDGLADINTKGTAVGHLGDSPAYYENNKWHLLPMPSNREMGSANSITEDGNIIVGESEVSFVYGPGLPLIWTKEGDGYKLDSLPCPRLDPFGQLIARCSGTYISEDGSVILGRFQDKQMAQFAVLIMWKKVDGKWQYAMVGEDLIYDKSKEHPGNMPLMANYVTAEQGTPEYEEQVQQFNDALNEFYKKLQGEDYKGAYYRMRRLDTNVGGFTMSPNGKYVVGTVKDMLTQNTFAYSVNLEDNSMTEYAGITDDGSGRCVGNDGTLFFSFLEENEKKTQYSSTVLLPGKTTPISLIEYFKFRSGMDYSDDIQNLNGNTGTPIISDDGNTIVCWVGTSDFVQCDVNYYVKFQPVSSISTVSIGSNSTLFCKDNILYANNGNMEQVMIYDLTGKLLYSRQCPQVDVSNLSKGVYLVKAVIDGNIASQKIVIK